MLYIDVEESTVKKATEVALKKIGLREDEVKIEVLLKEKRSLLGIGKPKLAKVRVHYKEKNVADVLLDNIKKIITLVEKNCQIEINKMEENRYRLIVSSPDIAHLVGKQGRTLFAFQAIVNSLLQKHENTYKVIIDVGKYNSRKENFLVTWAQEEAQKVLDTQQPVLLKPLNSYERRLIHMELKKFKDIHTESNGTGSKKNIRISYKPRS